MLRFWTMVSKALVAVVAIVAVAAVGIGVFLFMNNGDDPVPLDVDEVRTDLKVGDYIELKEDYDIVVEETLKDKEASDLVKHLYLGWATSDKSTKTVDYKGKSIVCDYYTYSDEVSSMACALDPETGVAYEFAYSDETDTRTYVLKDTNLDLSLTEDEQKVVSGSFILFDYSTHLTSALVLKGELEYSMSEYDPETDLGTMMNSMDVGIHETVKETIIQITPAGEIVTDITEKLLTKDDYLSDVLFDSFVRSMEDFGMVVTYGDKSTDTIDTVYGKRHVTIQTLDVYDPGTEITYVYTLSYGDKGMIYSEELSSDSDAAIKKGTWILEGTSLKI